MQEKCEECVSKHFLLILKVLFSNKHKQLNAWIQLGNLCVENSFILVELLTTTHFLQGNFSQKTE